MFYKSNKKVSNPKLQYKVTIVDTSGSGAAIQIENLSTGEKKKITYTLVYNNAEYSFENYILHYVTPYWRIYTINDVPMLYSKDGKTCIVGSCLRMNYTIVDSAYIGIADQITCRV